MGGNNQETERERESEKKKGMSETQAPQKTDNDFISQGEHCPSMRGQQLPVAISEFSGRFAMHSLHILLSELLPSV